MKKTLFYNKFEKKSIPDFQGAFEIHSAVEEGTVPFLTHMLKADGSVVELDDNYVSATYRVLYMA